MSEVVIMITGASGSGKSTLERGLVENYGDIKKIVSVTTRPQRHGEINGVDYHFITEQKFEAMVLQNELIQTTTFAGYSYGSSFSEYTTDAPIAVLVVTPSSAASLKSDLGKLIPNTIVKHIHFDISYDRLVTNMQARGDTDVMITNRLEQDDLYTQMCNSGLIPDYVITDESLNEHTTNDVAHWIFKLFATIHKQEI